MRALQATLLGALLVASAGCYGSYYAEAGYSAGYPYGYSRAHPYAYAPRDDGYVYRGAPYRYAPAPYRYAPYRGYRGYHRTTVRPAPYHHRGGHPGYHGGGHGRHYYGGRPYYR